VTESAKRNVTKYVAPSCCQCGRRLAVWRIAAYGLKKRSSFMRGSCEDRHVAVVLKRAFYGVAAIRQSSARNHRLLLIKEGRFLNRPLRNSGFPNHSLLDSKLRLLGK